MEAPVKCTCWIYLEDASGNRASDAVFVDDADAKATLIANRSGALRVAFSNGQDKPTIGWMEIDQPFIVGDAYVTPTPWELCEIVSPDLS
jgi:hypothetical protein